MYWDRNVGLQARRYQNCVFASSSLSEGAEISAQETAATPISSRAIATKKKDDSLLVVCLRVHAPLIRWKHESNVLTHRGERQSIAFLPWSSDDAKLFQSQRRALGNLQCRVPRDVVTSWRGTAPSSSLTMFTSHLQPSPTTAAKKSQRRLLALHEWSWSTRKGVWRPSLRRKSILC